MVPGAGAYDEEKEAGDFGRDPVFCVFINVLGSGEKWLPESPESGDLISCRVVFDAGIHSKAVGFEFKRSGLYTLAMKDEQKTYILHGHAEKVIHGKNGYCGIYVPIKRYQNGSFQTVWYLASFFNSNISVVKGDTVFLRGYRISDKSYNGFDYLDLTCSDIIGIHNL